MAPQELWPPRFSVAIFDFDGTLSDTAGIWRQVDEVFLSSRGLPYEEDYPQAMNALGFAAGAAYTIQRFGLEETVEDICDEWNRLGRALYETQASLRPGALRYLRELRSRGIPLGLATTNDPEVLLSMQRVDLRSLFDVLVTNREVEAPKSEPDIYLACADELGGEPRETIVFEDIVPGTRAAREAGFLTCGVRCDDPTQEVEALRESAELWLDDWRDIEL
ncbi:HAD family phosphatase [uncultured Olsenella sp.]|uniref:HAD family hydrolase n=1 Tax=uncultured Olsenella sp. TaxID=190764 RepID=UPI0026DC54A2|nr:HAD family phosphatase [uncultured Olsenella sp.]